MIIVLPSFVDSFSEHFGGSGMMHPTGFGGESDVTILIAVCLTSYMVFLGGLTVLGFCAGRRLHSLDEERALNAFRSGQRYEYLKLLSKEELTSADDESSDSDEEEDEAEEERDVPEESDPPVNVNSDAVWGTPRPVVHDLRSSQIIA